MLLLLLLLSSFSVSDSVRPHRQQPTRLLCLWDSPGKNTGVGCHFLLQCMKVKSETEVAQSGPTFSDPMDCSLPGSSIHGIFQARVLERGAIAFPNYLLIYLRIRGSSNSKKWASYTPGHSQRFPGGWYKAVIRKTMYCINDQMIQEEYL